MPLVLDAPLSAWVLADGPGAPVPLAAGEDLTKACQRALAAAPPPRSGRLACGPDVSPGFSGGEVVAVRVYTLGDPLWTEADVSHVEVWYDEDVHPLHAHLVLTVTPPGDANDPLAQRLSAATSARISPKPAP